MRVALNAASSKPPSRMRRLATERDRARRSGRMCARSASDASLKWGLDGCEVRLCPPCVRVCACVCPVCVPAPPGVFYYRFKDTGGSRAGQTRPLLPVLSVVASLLIQISTAEPDTRANRTQYTTSSSTSYGYGRQPIPVHVMN